MHRPIRTKVLQIVRKISFRSLTYSLGRVSLSLSLVVKTVFFFIKVNFRGSSSHISRYIFACFFSRHAALETVAKLALARLGFPTHTILDTVYPRNRSCAKWLWNDRTAIMYTITFELLLPVRIMVKVTVYKDYCRNVKHKCA